MSTTRRWQDRDFTPNPAWSFGTTSLDCFALRFILGLHKLSITPECSFPRWRERKSLTTFESSLQQLPWSLNPLGPQFESHLGAWALRQALQIEGRIVCGSHPPGWSGGQMKKHTMALKQISTKRHQAGITKQSREHSVGTLPTLLHSSLQPACPRTA